MTRLVYRPAMALIWNGKENNSNDDSTSELLGQNGHNHGHV